MTIDNMQETLDRLEKLMYGHNYEVSFGFDIFDNCSTIEVFNTRLKELYPQTSPDKLTPKQFDKSDFLEEINFALKYRGDKIAGLKLTTEEEKQLLIQQENYIKFIDSYISDNTKFYSYPDELGMAGYIVFWGYNFLLLNADKSSLLIYGSGSD